MCRVPRPAQAAIEPAARAGEDRGLTSPTSTRRQTMILATTTVKDLDHFLEIYGTKGADKRIAHGCKGSVVYRDPVEENRVWAVFDWDEAAGPLSPPTPRRPASCRRPATWAAPPWASSSAPSPAEGRETDRGARRHGREQTPGRVRDCARGRHIPILEACRRGA